MLPMLRAHAVAAAAASRRATLAATHSARKQLMPSGIQGSVNTRACYHTAKNAPQLWAGARGYTTFGIFSRRTSLAAQAIGRRACNLNTLAAASVMGRRMPNALPFGAIGGGKRGISSSGSERLSQMHLKHQPSKFGVELSSDWFYAQQVTTATGKPWLELELASGPITLGDWYPSLDPPNQAEEMHMISTLKRRKKKMNKHKLKKRRKRDRMKKK